MHLGSLDLCDMSSPQVPEIAKHFADAWYGFSRQPYTCLHAHPLAHMWQIVSTIFWGIFVILFWSTN